MGLFEAYKILGVAPGSQPDAVKHAYRGLVWVWHPDLLGHDPQLMEIAGERIKLYNQAYEVITKCQRSDNKPYQQNHKETWDSSDLFSIRVECPVCKHYLEVSPYARRLVCPECNTPLLVKEPVQRKVPNQGKVSPCGDCLSTMHHTEPWPSLEYGPGTAGLARPGHAHTFNGLAGSIHYAMHSKNKYGRTNSLLGQIGAIVL